MIALGYGSLAASRVVLLFGLTTILVVSGLALVLSMGDTRSTNSSTTGGPPLRYVHVFGLASTVGQGTQMGALGFTNTRTGASFSAPVSNGKFSIDLPNGAVYLVTAEWAGNYSWQKGAAGRGDLTVNMSEGSTAAMSHNLILETPPTIVAVYGTILWTLPSAHPVSVVYAASDGESFQAEVHNVTFSTRLPNMMDYQVKVFWQYADGTTDYLFAANQTIDEGVGVVGLDVEIK